MVFSHYLIKFPYQICWYFLKALRGNKKAVVLHIEDAFDLFLFRNVGKYLQPITLVSDQNSVIKALKKQNIRVGKYPCFPDAVIMFRNAAWKYPLARVIKIGFEHGAYNFKKFPKAYYYNLFDVYFMTSYSDVRRIKATGVRTCQAIGYPKTDSLFDCTYSPQILESLRGQMGFAAAKPTILMSSTWDGSGMSAIHKWYDQIFSLADKYNIMVTLHPMMHNRYKEYLRSQPSLHYIDAEDIYPYLLLADVCVGDTNSLLAEFCLLNKPIITFSIDKTRRTTDDVMEMIKSISLPIEGFAQLDSAIQTALVENQDKAQRRYQILKVLIDPLDGKAGYRAAQVITRLLPDLSL